MGTRRAVSFNQAAGRAGCIFTATKAPTVVFNISKKWNFHIAADQNSVDNIEVEFLISRVTRCHRPFDSLTNRFLRLSETVLMKIFGMSSAIRDWCRGPRPYRRLQSFCNYGIDSSSGVCLLSVCCLFACVRSPLFASHNNGTHLCLLPQL